MNTYAAQDQREHARTTPSAQEIPLPTTVDNQDGAQKPTTTASATKRTGGGETEQWERRIPPTGSTTDADADATDEDAAETAEVGHRGTEEQWQIA